tara:strand:+ start:287 stop:943 length:657 start_codon:yes stop_codon:yes gene_type:complete
MNRSLKYLFRRLGFYFIASFAALTLNFFIPRFMPGDPASIIFARFQGKLKPEAINALRETFGLTNEPLTGQYITYLKSIIDGDLGISIAYFPEQVTSIIGSGLMWTIFLAGSALIISFSIGTFLGILISWNRSGRLDSFLPPIFAFIGAFPYFWLAMLFLYIFGFKTGWFPLSHAYSQEVYPGFNFSFMSSVIYHSILPASTMILVGLGGWMLSMRII